uniref:Uncharacterized protein n=1 Tax=Biomphalaria glabrata TaxID=6526 RepID=A0A2C9MA30_BIOGL
MVEEKMILKEELDKAQSTIKRHDEELDEYVREKVAAANKLLIQEFESERAHHQKLVKEHARLQQRLENLHSEMQVSLTNNVLSIKSLIYFRVNRIGEHVLHDLLLQ